MAYVFIQFQISNIERHMIGSQLCEFCQKNTVSQQFQQSIKIQKMKKHYIRFLFSLIFFRRKHNFFQPRRMQAFFESKFIYLMLKQRKSTKKSHSQWTFYMKGGAGTQYKKQVIVDFSVHQGPFVRAQMRQLRMQRVNIPTFNIDCKEYTPGFYIPAISINDEHCKQKFTQKMQTYEQISESKLVNILISRQMVPRPRNKDYCNVCEEKFEDYLDHSKSEGHLKELVNNKFHSRIKKLCQKFIRSLLKDQKRGERQSSLSQIHEDKTKETFTILSWKNERE